MHWFKCHVKVLRKRFFQDFFGGNRYKIQEFLKYAVIEAPVSWNILQKEIRKIKKEQSLRQVEFFDYGVFSN